MLEMSARKPHIYVILNMNKGTVCILCILVLKPAATVGLCLSNYIGFLERWGEDLHLYFHLICNFLKKLMANLQMHEMH